jgi:transcription initiation factor TFIIB
MHVGDSHERRFDESAGQTLDSNTACPECEGRVVADGGERHCADCGLIVGQYHIDHGATKRQAPESESDIDPRQVGAPQTKTMHDGGLTTRIGRYRDGRGQTLDRKTKRRFHRLRRQHRHARHGSKRERNLELGLQEVSRLVGALGIGESREEQAAVIFRQAQSEDLLRGRSIEGIAAASVHAACRCAGLPRSIDEVGNRARVSSERVRSAYQVLNEELGLPAVPQTPSDFVPKHASALDVGDRIRKRALDLAEIAVETGVANGRQPSGIAAACLYQAAREYGPSRTQKQVAEVADVTVVTVRVGWQELCERVC